MDKRDCLSTPLSFESLGKGDEKAITASLERAVDFVLKLEQREIEVNPDDRDMSVMDLRLGGTRAMERAGYSSGEIRGPSSSWIEN